MMRGLVFFFILTSLVSCSTDQYRAEYVSRIDSLVMSLEAGASSYESLDTVKIKNQFNTISDQLSVLKSDSNITNKQSVGVYNRLRKGYKGFIREDREVRKELNYTRSQLKHLKNDIEKNNISEEKIPVYFKQETQAVVNIKNAMDAYYKRIISMMNTYDELYPEFKRLTDSLTKQQNIEK